MTAADVVRMPSIKPLGSPAAWPNPGTAPTTVGGSSTNLASDTGIFAGIVKRIGVLGACVARGLTTTSVGGGAGTAV